MRNALLRPGSTADGKDADHLAKVLTACVAHVSLLHEQQHKALVSLLLSMPIWESTQVRVHVSSTSLVDFCLLQCYAYLQQGALGQIVHVVLPARKHSSTGETPHLSAPQAPRLPAGPAAGHAGGGDSHGCGQHTPGGAGPADAGQQPAPCPPLPAVAGGGGGA